MAQIGRADLGVGVNVEGRLDTRSEQEALRQNAARTQDVYRVRVSLPQGGALTGPRSAVAPSSGQTTPSAGVGRPTGGVSSHTRDFFLGLLVCLSGGLVLRRFAPETAQPWRGGRPVGLHQVADGATRPEGLPDEREFAAFLVDFKAGPANRHDQGALLQEQAQQRMESTKPRDPGHAEVSLKLFLASTPEHLLAMWNLFEAIQRELPGQVQSRLLGDLRNQLRQLKYAASCPQLLPVWQVASMTEGLVAQLAERTSNVTWNGLRTIADGLALLVELCQPQLNPELSTSPAIRLLAVDDDLISRRAVASALKPAFGQPDLASNGEAALAQISLIAYDVIFLDILMPGVDGFELCSRIRKTRLNQKAPVVFVTSLADPETRTKCSACGGTDLITKPFSTFEISLRALILALGSRLGKPIVSPLGHGEAELTPVCV